MKKFRDLKSTFIIIRITEEEKSRLVKKAGRNLSKYIRILLKLD